MAAKSANTAKTGSSGKGDFTYIIIYVLEWLTGIVFFIISGNDKRKKLHSIQAILLGIVALIVYFVLGWIPFVGAISWIVGLLIWVYGLYIGYMASTGTDVEIPGITGFAKQYV